MDTVTNTNKSVMKPTLQSQHNRPQNQQNLLADYQVPTKRINEKTYFQSDNEFINNITVTPHRICVYQNAREETITEPELLHSVTQTQD
jgi:hypothetical protein